MTKFMLVLLFSLGVSAVSFAQSRVTYDLTGSSGTRDGESFTEIHLGLNWFIKEHINWRNSVFTQFGNEIKTIYGLDTEALFNWEAYTQSRGLGIELFAGPGFRFASENSNAVFGKAGLTFGIAGLRIGGGVQAFHYWEDRKDKDENILDKDEVQYFVIIAGGGSF